MMIAASFQPFNNRFLYECLSNLSDALNLNGLAVFKKIINIVCQKLLNLPASSDKCTKIAS